ncbi:MAG: winged helix-turn-helix transcriptional regulator [Alphaproteobacteria bacterium]|nr:winged helix-turn-helix transcriptional regulator [Alphaproteobacteria bacterium]
MNKNNELEFILKFPHDLKSLEYAIAEQLKIMQVNFSVFPETHEFNSSEDKKIIITENWITKELSIPLRLGEFNDMISYLRSGREKYVESESIDDLGLFWLHAHENLMIDKQSGDKIRLTDIERLFLRTLFLAKNNIASREELLRDVWGYHQSVETHTMETHLYRLRQKLAPYGGEGLIRADGQGQYSLFIKSGKIL